MRTLQNPTIRLLTRAVEAAWARSSQCRTLSSRRATWKKGKKKKIRLLPCPRLGRDLPPTAASPWSGSCAWRAGPWLELTGSRTPAGTLVFTSSPMLVAQTQSTPTGYTSRGQASEVQTSVSPSPLAAVYPDRNKWKCIIGIEKRCEYQCGLLPPIYGVLWICSTWFVWPCSGVFPPLKWHTDQICGTNLWAGSLSTGLDIVKLDPGLENKSDEIWLSANLSAVYADRLDKSVSGTYAKLRILRSFIVYYSCPVENTAHVDITWLLTLQKQLQPTSSAIVLLLH